MTAQSVTTLKTYFETADVPTAAQFVNLIDVLPTKVPPALTTLTWNNQGASTYSTDSTSGNLLLTATATGNASNYGMRALEVANAASGDFDIRGFMRVSLNSTSTEHGIYVRSGSIVYALYIISTTIRADSRAAPDSTTQTTIGSTAVTAQPFWLRIARSGSTITFYASLDGRGWMTIATATDATAMTHAGVFAELRATSGDVTAWVESFSVE